MDSKILFIDVLTYLFAAVVFFMLPAFALWDMFKKRESPTRSMYYGFVLF